MVILLKTIIFNNKNAAAAFFDNKQYPASGPLSHHPPFSIEAGRDGRWSMTIQLSLDPVCRRNNYGYDHKEAVAATT